MQSQSLRHSARPLVLRFAFVALFPILLSADVVSTCTATATDPGGNTSPVACQDTGLTVVGGFFEIPTSGQPYLLHLMNYITGGVTTAIPGASISVLLDQEVSAVGSYEIDGGSGNGELELEDGPGFTTFPACYSNGVGGVCPQMTWTSNVLPIAGTFTPIYVPFTFGVPFSISVDAKMTLSATDPNGAAGLAWEALIEDDLRVIRVLDSNGNPDADATFVAPVPEPSAIWLLGAACLFAAPRLRQRVLLAWNGSLR